MDLVQIVVLAVVQGITEFLPISSSGHLILVPLLTGWSDQGQAFDVALHMGTLLAVVSYFRRDIGRILADFGTSLVERRTVGDSRLAWAIAFATIPAGLAGLALKVVGDEALRTPHVIIATTLCFGLLLGWSDWRGRKNRVEQQLSWGEVFLIGIAQAVALIPGTSRSGITMTTGLFLGLNRTAAARFSFLLSIPIIVLAAGVNLLGLIRQPEVVDWLSLGLGTALAAGSGWLAIHFLLKLLNRFGMWPFVLYRLLLGGVLIALFVL